MEIKREPEDFIVEEIPLLAGEGKYCLYKATKRRKTTFQMISDLAKENNMRVKDFGYAGLKDKHAITTQYITTTKKITSNNYDIELIGTQREHLRLGNLKGNKFKIIVYDVKKTRELEVPNYFDEQRFSKQNVEIGIHLLKAEFLQAAQKIGESNEVVMQRLKANEKQPIAALRKLPIRKLLIYVHSVQSLLWNQVVADYVGGTEVKYSQGVLRFPDELAEEQVPLIGVVSELGKFRRSYQEKIKKLGLQKEDFMVRSIPNLTLEGSSRSLRSPVKSKQVKLKDGVAEVEMVLGKGAYATICLKAWLA